MSILIPLLKEMKPATTSAILSQMNAERVKEVTAELIGHNY
jgi:flagellar motility protein MotE (MotC chaperone)